MFTKEQLVRMVTLVGRHAKAEAEMKILRKLNVVDPNVARREKEARQDLLKYGLEIGYYSESKEILAQLEEV